LVRMRSRATHGRAGLVSAWWTGLQQAVQCASPEGACLPANATIFLFHTLLDHQTYVCSSRSRPGPQWRGERTQAEMRPPDKRGPSFYWLAGGLRDTVIQHHHGQHHIGTLRPRIADLRKCKQGWLHTGSLAAFGNSLTACRFRYGDGRAVDRRTGHWYRRGGRLYRPKNQLSR
jgi:hypothetical protein